MMGLHQGGKGSFRMNMVSQVLVLPHRVQASAALHATSGLMIKLAQQHSRLTYCWRVGRSAYRINPHHPHVYAAAVSTLTFENCVDEWRSRSSTLSDHIFHKEEQICV